MRRVVGSRRPPSSPTLLGSLSGCGYPHAAQISASPAGISSGSGAGGWIRPDLMFSELSPRPGVNPACRSPRSRAWPAETARPGTRIARGPRVPARRSVLVPDRETGQRLPCLLERDHIPQPLGHGLLQVPSSWCVHAGSNEDCSEATAAAGWRSRKIDWRPARRRDRSQTSTLPGVLTTSRGLPCAQRLGEHPVPAHMLHVFGGQPEPVQGGPDPLRLRADAEMLQRRLRRSVQLGVAAQDRRSGVDPDRARKRRTPASQRRPPPARAASRAGPRGTGRLTPRSCQHRRAARGGRRQGRS